MVSGGAVVIEISSTTIGSDQFQTMTPGHKTVSPLSARLHTFSGHVFDWIADTIGGGPWKRNVLLAPVGGGSAFEFIDAFPISVTFINPLIPLVNGNMPAVIDLTVKPIRVAVQ